MDNALNTGNSSGIPLAKAAYAASQHRQATGVQGVMVNLFRAICREISNQRGISPVQWNKLMSDYLRNLPENQSGYDRMSVRGNLNKEFRRTKMSWLVFCKGMVFLKFACFNIRIDAVTEEGQSFNANTSVLLTSLEKLASIVSHEVIDEFFPKTSKFPPNALGIHYGNAQKPNYDNSEKGVMARLFNLLCLEYSGGTGIGQLQWNKLLTSYIESYGHTYVARDPTSIRGNLKKEFRKGSMSWKVLCKGLRFLRVSSFVVTITGIREDGNEYATNIEVVFTPRQPTADLEGEE